MPEFYKLVHGKIDPPKEGKFRLVTAADWPCALCGELIDGMGGPGNGEICIPCGNLMKSGRLRDVIAWTDETREAWRKHSEEGL